MEDRKKFGYSYFSKKLNITVLLRFAKIRFE